MTIDFGSYLPVGATRVALRQPVLVGVGEATNRVSLDVGLKGTKAAGVKKVKIFGTARTNRCQFQATTNIAQSSWVIHIRVESL